MLAESIKLVLVKRNMSKAELARKLGCSTSNLYNKLSRNNFSEQEMNKIAEVLDCHFEASLVLNAGRDIIVVEDILDSGNTLYFLKDYMLAKGANSITIVTLLDKPSRREKPIYPDLAGFEVPDEFVVGFGLDYCQQYRNMPYIGVLKPEVYSK